jgi:hypothetical protein
MEAVQVHLPSELVQRLRQEIPSDEALSRVVVEAVHMWLEKRRTEKVQKARGLGVLRQAGLAMEGGRQRALADAMMPPFIQSKFPVMSRSKRR